MKRYILNLVSFLVIATLVLLAGCYVPGGPVPEEPYPNVERAWSQEEVDAAVAVEEVSIYSPAPTGNGVAPEVADYVTFLRFRSRSAGEDPAGADAVLVVMPGFYCGSNSFWYLGRQMVYMASLQGADVEVWAVERRPNRLEDLAGLNAAEAAGDAAVAIDYYSNDVPVGGDAFGGFLTDATAPYLSEFGMQLVMEDVYKVITTMVPDPEVRRSKVFVGGHSLGGPLSHIFAAWDFDGDPATLDDAGYRNCAGLVGLDGALSLTMGMMEPALDALPEEPPAASDSGGMEAYYAGLVQGLRDGNVPRIFPLLTPDAPIVMELVAMEADQRPSGGVHPAGGGAGDGAGGPHAQAAAFPLPGPLPGPRPGHQRFPLHQRGPLRRHPRRQLHAGEDRPGQHGLPRGRAPWWRRTSPCRGPGADTRSWATCSGRSSAWNGSSSPTTPGRPATQLGQGPLYEWADFDQVGRASDPDYRDTQGTMTYTTMVEEVSDIRDVAQVVYKGSSNLLEWYFTTRLMVDMLALLFPFAPDYGLNYLHASELGELPMLEVMAGSNLNPFSQGTPPGERLVLEGYNHIDVLTAAADRPSLRENESFPPIIDFMLEHSATP